MTYTIEKVSMCAHGVGRRPNPITVTMRKLAIGESFVVPYDDRAWTGSQVRNENSRKHGVFVSEKTGAGIRIGRVA